jgi:hypothetical protein
MGYMSPLLLLQQPVCRIIFTKPFQLKEAKKDPDRDDMARNRCGREPFDSQGRYEIGKFGISETVDTTAIHPQHESPNVGIVSLNGIG